MQSWLSSCEAVEMLREQHLLPGVKKFLRTVASKLSLRQEIPAALGRPHEQQARSNSLLGEQTSRESRQSNANWRGGGRAAHLLNSLREGAIPVLASGVLALHRRSFHSVLAAGYLQESDLWGTARASSAGRAALTSFKGTKACATQACPKADC